MRRDMYVFSLSHNCCFFQFNLQFQSPEAVFRLSELYLYNTITLFIPQLRIAFLRNETFGSQRVNERPATAPRAFLARLHYSFFVIQLYGSKRLLGNSAWFISNWKIQTDVYVFANGNSFQFTTALNVTRKVPNECTQIFYDRCWATRSSLSLRLHTYKKYIAESR